MYTRGLNIFRRPKGLVTLISFLSLWTLWWINSQGCSEKTSSPQIQEATDSSVSCSEHDDVFPTMTSYPGIHVVTSGTENIQTRETVSACFIWCGSKIFRFRNYVSVLSAVYAVKPIKILFLHTHDMPIDDHRYNTWFQMLLDTVPNLVTKNIGNGHSCDTDIHTDGLVRKMLPSTDEHWIFIGANTIMAEFPVYMRLSEEPVGSAISAIDQGFLYTKYKRDYSYHVPNETVCTTVESYTKKDICVTTDSDINPKDIWTLESPFGALVRKLVYGHPDVIKPRQDYSNLTPRIAHFFSFREKNFTYGNYLSVLSAIYVAGLESAYIYGTRPKGELFEQLLKEENVTYIHMPEVAFMFNHRLKYTTHNADIGKLYTLSRIGGVTQDLDIFWTRPITDELLSYDSVVSFDWPEHGEFPEVFNLGVLMGKPNAFYFKSVLQAMHDYRDDTVHHLAMRLPYKTYEMHPSAIMAERHLQVICWLGKCHPSWMPDYIQPLSGDIPGMDFDWRQVFSVHCTWPKPPFEMTNFSSVKNAKGLFAEIGRNILHKAGKL